MRKGFGPPIHQSGTLGARWVLLLLACGFRYEHLSHCQRLLHILAGTEAPPRVSPVPLVVQSLNYYSSLASSTLTKADVIMGTAMVPWDG